MYSSWSFFILSVLLSDKSDKSDLKVSNNNEFFNRRGLVNHGILDRMKLFLENLEFFLEYIRLSFFFKALAKELLYVGLFVCPSVGLSVRRLVCHKN